MSDQNKNKTQMQMQKAPQHKNQALQQQQNIPFVSSY